MSSPSPLPCVGRKKFPPRFEREWNPLERPSRSEPGVRLLRFRLRVREEGVSGQGETRELAPRRAVGTPARPARRHVPVQNSDGISPICQVYPDIICRLFLIDDSRHARLDSPQGATPLPGVNFSVINGRLQGSTEVTIAPATAAGGRLEEWDRRASTFLMREPTRSSKEISSATTPGEGVTGLLYIHQQEPILIVRNPAVTDGSGTIPAYCTPPVFQIN